MIKSQPTQTQTHTCHQRGATYDLNRSRKSSLDSTQPHATELDLRQHEPFHGGRKGGGQGTVMMDLPRTRLVKRRQEHVGGELSKSSLPPTLWRGESGRKLFAPYQSVCVVWARNCINANTNFILGAPRSGVHPVVINAVTVILRVRIVKLRLIYID